MVERWCWALPTGAPERNRRGYTGPPWHRAVFGIGENRFWPPVRPGLSSMEASVGERNETAELCHARRRPWSVNQQPPSATCSSATSSVWDDTTRGGCRGE